MKITKYCKQFNKKPSHFTDNEVCQGHHITVVKGKEGYTEIPDSLAKEFFLWLHPTTRNLVLEGKTVSEIVDSLKTI